MKTNHFHQTAIVTGGATGIGYAVRHSLAWRLTSCSTAVPACETGISRRSADRKAAR